MDKCHKNYGKSKDKGRYGHNLAKKMQRTADRKAAIELMNQREDPGKIFTERNNQINQVKNNKIKKQSWKDKIMNVFGRNKSQI